jgi:hypothetical protein
MHEIGKRKAAQSLSKTSRNHPVGKAVKSIAKVCNSLLTQLSNAKDAQTKDIQDRIRQKVKEQRV